VLVVLVRLIPQQPVQAQLVQLVVQLRLQTLAVHRPVIRPLQPLPVVQVVLHQPLPPLHLQQVRAVHQEQSLLLT
jgi:hypothetical protein